MKKKLYEIVKFLQNYWFIISFVCSIIISVLYLLVFHVTPWDKYREIEMKRNREDFHIKVSYCLLEEGFYEESLQEFNKVLESDQNNYNAINGKYLCNLFLELKKDEWEPNYSLSIINNIKTSGVIANQNLDHIFEKYLGDFYYRLNSNKEAEIHYKKALRLNKNYIDALYSYGWFQYFEYNNFISMKKYFNQIIKIDSFNYKGYHGSGYALYMQAIKSKDAREINSLLDSATYMCNKAYKYKFFYICTLMDFGEICRVKNPELSMNFHLYSNGLINDEKKNKICGNNQPFSIKLLVYKSGSTLTFESIEQKSAWINYQLALDYYALFKNDIDRNNSEINFYKFYNEAVKLDKGGSIILCFIDQKKIYDDFYSILKNLKRTLPN